MILDKILPYLVQKAKKTHQKLQWQRSREPTRNKETPQTEKTPEENYTPYLIKLTRFKDGIRYELDHGFTNKELGAITPPAINRWVCLKVYGNPDPERNDNPTQGHSSSIAYA